MWFERTIHVSSETVGVNMHQLFSWVSESDLHITIQYNVGNTITNHAPVINIFIGGIYGGIVTIRYHSQSWLVYDVVLTHSNPITSIFSITFHYVPMFS